MNTFRSSVVVSCVLTLLASLSVAGSAFSANQASPSPSDSAADDQTTSGLGDSTSRKAGTRTTFEVDGVEYGLCWLPAGMFTMGSPSSEEVRASSETQHIVTLSRGGWLGETEVTQRLWKAVMGSNPSEFKGDELPVECVSWDDVHKFLAKLNALGVAPKGMKFALPTEAQWEYACRAGTTSPFSWGDKLNGDNANCNGHYPYGTSVKGKYLEKTSPVKSYAANAWGLYDMHGNVCEWCEDWYGDYANDAMTTDPTGPASGSYRVHRGGSWGNGALACRVAHRAFYGPSDRGNGLGFRVACVAEQ